MYDSNDILEQQQLQLPFTSPLFCDLEAGHDTKARRRVRFQAQDEVRVIPPFDESLKSDLFYCKADFDMFLAYFEVFQFQEYQKERSARGK